MAYDKADIPQKAWEVRLRAVVREEEAGDREGAEHLGEECERVEPRDGDDVVSSDVFYHGCRFASCGAGKAGQKGRKQARWK